MNSDKLLVIIATEESKSKVLPGGTPVFIASDKNEQQSLAMVFSRVLCAMAHDLENGVLVIVKH